MAKESDDKGEKRINFLRCLTFFILTFFIVGVILTTFIVIVSGLEIRYYHQKDILPKLDKDPCEGVIYETYLDERCGFNSADLPIRQQVYSNICECRSHKNDTIILDLGCTKEYPFCEFGFKQRYELAQIDYNWYCVCNVTKLDYYCEWTEIEPQPGCKFETYQSKHTIINTTEEIYWSW
jgi:hypothetical protein